MKRLFIITLIILLGHGITTAQESKLIKGFSGGMMIHTGYLNGCDNPRGYNMQGTTFGIGGVARLHLTDHFRTGFEGYVSTMNSGATDMRNVLQSGSYVRVGSGGVLADACWRMEKIWPFIGAAVGGGAMRTLYVVEGTEEDWQPEDFAMLTKQSFSYIDPYIGMDWCMTKRVHLTLRMDWMLAFADKQILLPTGPRFFFGFMFCH